eukprot:CAMPEP_0176272038 /NCGR_PEP_ID=MMETSP0121_2-20121125/45509_1 /TAXON_ID=160619 /ORGANISM="Kryptoperidinium foliaceum, Strain CCMP 1326" /LENGTH=182 /DNA_ID=CAMNT_0017612201 /DNA_START=71 /DNA_END=619 /DNA_ORIENTATION=-
MGKPGQAKQVFRKYGSKARGVKKGEKRAKSVAPKLKKGLTPGTVLILLAGRFRGSRVVYLKQLDSGLLLATGPYSVNGVPLRRVNQRYCIATSTKVDVGSADVSSVTDVFFAKDAKAKGKGKKDAEGMFAEAPAKAGPSDEKKACQKKVDDAVTKGLNVELKQYLKTRFGLSSRMYPHELKF